MYGADIIEGCGEIRGPPGNFFLGSRQTQKGTTTYFERNLNQPRSGKESTYLSSQVGAFDIPYPRPNGQAVPPRFLLEIL